MRAVFELAGNLAALAVAGALTAPLAQARISAARINDARIEEPAVPGPELSSTVIDVAACPADATRATSRCEAPAGYALIETRSELSNFRFIVHAEHAFQTFLEPAQCERAAHDGSAELRLYEGRPFAIIQKVNCLAPVEATPARGAAKQKNRVLSSTFVVRGLHGFETLQSELPVEAMTKKGIWQAGERARRRADEYLLAQWARLEPAVRAERERAIELAFAAAVEAQRQARADAFDEDEDESSVDDASATAASLLSDDPDAIVVVIDVGE